MIALVALLVGAAFAGSGRGGTYLQVVDGTLVKKAEEPAVYLVDRGVLRHVTGDAFGRLYSDFRRVVTVVEIPRHLVQEQLGNGTRLVKARGVAAIWLIDNGRTRRHVANLGRYGFVGSKVEVVERVRIDSVPIGPRLD